MKKHDTFTTPESYFEETKKRLKKIPASTSQKYPAKVIGLKHYMLGALATAAMIVLAFFIWPAGEGMPADGQAPALSQIEDEALLDYLNSNATLVEFNYFLVEEAYQEEDITLKDEDMMDYLESQPLDFYNL